MRIGHGYDVHRLTEKRKLILGGVEVPYKLGLLGHSDADVLTHALMDALLGAAGLGDIGKLFPDHDSAYEGISSMELLMRVMEMLAERKLRVCNADMTILCQQPKLSRYLPKMRDSLAQRLKVPEERVNIKATTEEGLGFTGRGEGIAAHAVVLLEESE